jgi:hypothetical protein
MAHPDKFCHMALAALVMCLAPAAVAHPLEDAAHEAMALCARLEGVETIEQCINSISPSPSRPAAKAALQRLFKAQEAFVQECNRGMLVRCQEQADLYIWAGISKDRTLSIARMGQPLPPPAQRR